MNDNKEREMLEEVQKQLKALRENLKRGILDNHQVVETIKNLEGEIALFLKK